MFAFDHVKLEVFVPQTHTQALMDALAAAGIGVIGNYDYCFAVTALQGHFRPLAGANPYEGRRGEISQVAEAKIETICRRELIPAALQAIRRAHPYEEPVINLLPLVNDQFLSG
ncbi:MAG: hypothetical protein ACUVRJ_07520 [Candidatus Villigracilaceae bacterium]